MPKKYVRKVKRNQCKSAMAKKQLRMGIKVEMEHTSSPKVAKRIALDHLREFPGKPYYTELAKLEKKLKRNVKK